MTGLSCLARDNGKKPHHGRQVVHGCPFLPGDPRIKSGMRPDSELLLFISIPVLLQHGVPVWRSANDIVLIPGHEDIIYPRYIIQLAATKGPRADRCSLDLAPNGRLSAPRHCIQTSYIRNASSQKPHGAWTCGTTTALLAKSSTSQEYESSTIFARRRSS